MNEWFKSWKFWLIIILLITLILIYFFAPIKGCGLLTYDGNGGGPTGSHTVYQTYAEYFAHGCPT